MASERDLELLDEYLGNRLSAEDKLAFEKALQGDTSLNKEFQLQKRVVEGIKQARVTELKQLLNNVPLSSIPQEGPSALIKVGTWIVAAGVVGAGLFFFFKDDTSQVTPSTANQELITKEPSQVEVPKDEPTLAPVVKDSQVVATPKAEIQQQPSATTETTDSGVSKSADNTIAPGARDVFDPSEDSKGSNAATASEGVKSSTAVTPSIAMETLTDSKFKFHYQFKDNKLLLYGVFEKNLYEIMEFFSNNKRTMFLYYKESYYLLNEDNDKVKPLAPISDEALLKKLKDYRAGR